MKRSIKTIAACGIVLWTASIGQSHELDIHLAQDYNPAQAEAVMNAIGKALPSLRPGDKLVISPGEQDAVEAAIPSDDAHARIEKFRISAIRPAWDVAVHYMQGVSRDSSHSDNSVDVLRILNDARYAGGSDRDVVMIGSPLLKDKRSPGWSWEDAWPNDATFGLSRSDSPYGTADAPQLGGLRVHYCTLMQGSYVNIAHERMVERSLALLISGYGAKLATFTSDIGTCLDRALNSRSDGGPEYKRDRSAESPRMLLARNTLVSSQAITADQASLLANVSQDQKVRDAIGDILSKNPNVKLAKVWLSDDREEDGDVVAFDAQGIRLPVLLTNQEKEVIAVVDAGRIAIYAVKDGGGGGVTVRIRTEDNAVVSPVLEEGARFDVMAAFSDLAN